MFACFIHILCYTDSFYYEWRENLTAPVSYVKDYVGHPVIILGHENKRTQGNRKDPSQCLLLLRFPSIC
jgi:hypothetical protein